MSDKNLPVKQVHLKQSIPLLIGVIALISLGVFHTFPPSPAPTSTPLSLFSSVRAMNHVRQIGSKPHPTGSAGNTEIRNYLVAQLKELGLTPEVQSALVVNPQKKAVGLIHNVLVRIPGTETGKALLLVAHYDSVHTGPGAADDGASVAAIIETLRALKTQPSLKNDLICLFTDGEEIGLLGAKAFVEQHPLAKNIGLVLNFEYRGNRGAFMMFETSQGNGRLIEGLGSSVPFVLASSLMYEVYKRLPNDTDFSVFKQAGITGMNFAAIDGHPAYHTQLDNPDRLDQGTLQQEGEIMLGLAKHFGNLQLDSLNSPDCVYFDVPGLGLITYPQSWILPMNVLILLLFAAVVLKAARMKVMRISHVLSATLVFLIVLMSLAIASHYGWSVICMLHPEYISFLQGDTYNSQWYLIAFVLLNIGFFCTLSACAGRWIRPFEFSLGISAMWIILLMSVSVIAPGLSFLFYWPLAGVLGGLWFTLILVEKDRQSFNLLPICLGSVPGILLLTPIIRNLFIGLTPRMIGVVALFLALLSGLLTPLLERVGQQKGLKRLFILSGIVALGMGSWTSGFDIEHPRQNSLIYAFDTSSQKAYWLSTDKYLDRWTSAFFSNVSEKQPVSSLLGGKYSNMWLVAAPAFAAPAPDMEILEDKMLKGKAGNTRKLILRVKSLRNASKLKITAEGITVISSIIAGQQYTVIPDTNWSIDYFGLDAEGLNIEITVNADKPFVLRIMDVAYGLPALGQQPRPPTTIASPSELSDSSVFIKVFHI
jgi:hypothetical protein